jgi:hypothetical protein
MRFRISKLGREFFIPKGSIKVADKLSDAVAYISTNSRGKPRATIFVGKQTKPIADYWYGSDEKRTTAVGQAFESRRKSMAFKAETAAKRKAFVNSYKVGDLFKRSWGYDQTNVNYYEVIEVKGKFVWVREVKQEYVETGFMCGKTGPLVGQFLEKAEPKKCLAQENGIKVSDYGWASYCPGKIIGGVKVYDSAYTSSYA